MRPAVTRYVIDSHWTKLNIYFHFLAPAKAKRGVELRYITRNSATLHNSAEIGERKCLNKNVVSEH